MITRFVLLIAAGTSLVAQSIQYVGARKVWLLTTQHNSYAIGVDPNGALQNIYWGEPIWRVEDIPSATPHREYSSFDPGEMMDAEEYAGWGGRRYYEPALKIMRADGNRDLVPKYTSHRIQQNDLDIVLNDIRDDI